MENSLYIEFENKLKDNVLGHKLGQDTAYIATSILVNSLMKAVSMGYIRDTPIYEEIGFKYTVVDYNRGFCFDDPTIFPKNEYTAKMIQKLKEIKE
ncbi:MAG: hypothetical protein EHM14_15780 [Methanothrix sp.]|nr:MAG: hypothetical protein EHM14_15780 [Methanothrix sp.]